MTGQGGKCRLRWFAGRYSCDLTVQFKVNVESFSLIGPAPLEQRQTRVSRRVFTFRNLSGYKISELDGFVVLDTCGTEEVIHRFTNAHYPTVVESCRSDVSWGDVPTTFPGEQ